MRQQAVLIVILFVTATGLASCKKKSDANDKAAPSGGQTQVGANDAAAKPAAAADAAAPTAGKPDTPPAPAGPRGLAAADNNPKLVAVAKGVTDCKLDPNYPKNACREQVKAFVAAFDPAADLPTVINLLEDETPQVRLLGVAVMAEKMMMQQAATRAFAARILTAARAESDPTVAGLYGDVLLQGDFADATWADAIGKLFESHPLAQMRASVAANLLVQDPARYLPLLQARFAAESAKEVKLAILDGFYGVRSEHAAEICPWLLTIMPDPDNDLAGAAGYDIVWSQEGCKEYYDAFNTAYAARIATIKADFQFVLRTSYMAQAKGATDAQKTAFLDASKVIVEDTTISGMARGEALAQIGKYHPDGKAYAKKFLKDPDSSVASAAAKAAK